MNSRRIGIGIFLLGALAGTVLGRARAKKNIQKTSVVPETTIVTAPKPPVSSPPTPKLSVVDFYRHFSHPYTIAINASVPLTILLAALTLYLAYDNFSQSDGLSRISEKFNYTDVSGGQVGYSPNLTPEEMMAESRQRRDDVYSILYIDNINVQDKYLSGILSLSVPVSRLLQIVDANDCKIEAELKMRCEYIGHIDKETGNLSLKNGYDSRTINVSMFSAHVGSSVDFPIKLSSLFFPQAYNLVTVPVPVKLPIDGRQNLYPNDWYYFEGSFMLSPYDSLAFQTIYEMTDSTHSYSSGPVYIRTSISDKSNLSDFEINELSFIKNKPDSLITMYFTRKTIVKWHAFIVSSLPMLFSLLISLLLFNGDNTKDNNPQQIVIPMMAAMIAVIPIRSVIVPTDIHGFTRVDLLLELGVITSILIGLIRCIKFTRI